MTFVEVIRLFTLYGVDVIVLAFAVVYCAVRQIVKLVKHKNTPTLPEEIAGMLTGIVAEGMESTVAESILNALSGAESGVDAYEIISANAREGVCAAEVKATALFIERVVAQSL